MNDPAVGTAFIQRSRDYLSDEYLPKIRRCLSQLSNEQVWWRANEASNSVGNLVLHLAGNARQWIVSGVGGARDIRQRDLEFSRAGGMSARELEEVLVTALGAVDRTLEQLDPSVLLSERTIQGLDVTVLGAVYHVVEHFAMHTGQIVHITKQLTGADLQFYEVDGGVARRNW